MIYPSYYRKGSVCIKREDSRSGKQVDLSESSHRNPFRLIQTNDKAGFDKIVSGMELVSFETYERFLILLHNKSRQEARSFRETHDQSPEYTNLFPRRDFFFE
ncbi:MAG TPA: hypothetical protein VKZ68_06900 [Ohtaekwangia sp.]|nr:hypothetical protein [Ohtaekwangia sp.]